ncbi:hypothetical protein HPB49_026457 [Dermacentor silvarum]|nr:hypothetical protein HPB49_026457 [Dermacentor silvarum]
MQTTHGGDELLPISGSINAAAYGRAHMDGRRRFTSTSSSGERTCHIIFVSSRFTSTISSGEHTCHITFVSSSKGYNFVKENIVPLPAAKTLQKHTEHIKIRPGILDEVFVALKEKVATMAPNERHACVLIDKMQISPGLDYDSSIGIIIGQPTIGLSNPAMKDELASHALVFMLGGLNKQLESSRCLSFHRYIVDVQ